MGRYLAAVLVLVVLALGSCGREDPQSERRGPKDPPPGQTESGTTAVAASDPVGLGETAGSGPFAVTLNAAERRSSGGGRYAVVDLTLENRGREPADASEADYMLRDPRGYSFEPAEAPGQRPRPQGRVEPGSKSSGQVAFGLGGQRADGRLELAVSLPDRQNAAAAYFEFEAAEEKAEPEPESDPKQDTAQKADDPTPSVRPGYSVVEDPSGSLSVEVPSSWSSETGVDSEKEGGENSWSSYAGEYLTASITSARSLDAWYGGALGSGEGSGVYVVASEALAQRYTDDELIYSLLFQQKAATCVEGPSQGIDRPPFSGKVQAWFDCNGLDNASYVFVAAPEGRPCVAVGSARIVPGASEADREAVEHVVDSFEVDCGSLPPAEPLDSSATASASATSGAEREPPEETTPRDASPAPQSSGDLDCSDFDTQAEAQAVYERDTSDPNGLDGPQGEGYTGDPGIACEELPGAPTSSPDPSSPDPSSPEPSSPEPSSTPPSSSEPASPTATEGVPQNCDDFASQEAAQDFYDADPTDPAGLDNDGDGVACE